MVQRASHATTEVGAQGMGLYPLRHLALNGSCQVQYALARCHHSVDATGTFKG
jgi:hypothetical protein